MTCFHYFYPIRVSNISPSLWCAAPQVGNEAVLRARFQDAHFFFQEDLKRPLAEFRELLSGTLFQKDLGTLLDKSVCAHFYQYT